MLLKEHRNGTVEVLDANGNAVEEFTSSGCVYHDLDTCQGCPECRLGLDEDPTAEELWLHANRVQRTYGQVAGTWSWCSEDKWGISPYEARAELYPWYMEEEDRWYFELDDVMPSSSEALAIVSSNVLDHLLSRTFGPSFEAELNRIYDEALERLRNELAPTRKL